MKNKTRLYRRYNTLHRFIKNIFYSWNNLIDLNKLFGVCSDALENNPCQISWRCHVKKCFLNKHLSLIGQFVRQLYVIVFQYRRSNKQLLGEKRTCTKFQINISKTDGLACVYVYRRTDGDAKSPQLVTMIIYIYLYFLGLPTFLNGCYKHPSY